MNYTLVNQSAPNSMSLQSIGRVQGFPAGEIKKGDHLMWNFGSVYTVNDILKETDKTIVIATADIKGGKVYEQRLNKKRLVCILK